VVNWDIVAYYIDRRPNDDEYLFLLEHNVAFVEFIEAHQVELAQLAASSRRPSIQAVSQEGSDRP
jgi:hypothetical protein